VPAARLVYEDVDADHALLEENATACRRAASSPPPSEVDGRL